MARVRIEFQGAATGAVNAARQTRTAIREVGSSATHTTAELGRLSRGAVAGSGVFRGLGRSIAFASAGFLGGYGLTAAIGGAVNELRNSIRVSAQTDQALRSTGNVAGISAKGIDQLAKSLLRKTGVDDEAIKTSENLLLTFTQVRNEAGRGNDVFNQATRAIIDMSAVIGDTSSNSIQLGKALNDPLTGMTALRRVGVSFTAQQREQIKVLMEHGRILEAQKIILGEVQREFGGQAAAQEKATGGLNILRESIKNTSAELLRGLIPQFRDGVTWLQKWVDWLTHTREGQARMKSVTDGLKDAIKAALDVIRAFIGAVRVINQVTGGFGNTVKLLIALKLVSVLLAWRTSFQRLAVAETEAAVAAGGGKGLFGWLTKLKGIGTITIALALIQTNNFRDQVRNAFANAGLGAPAGAGAAGAAAAPPSQGAFGNIPGAAASATSQGVVGVALQAARSPGAAAASFHLPGEASPWDCSAFAQAVFRKSGISIGRDTYAQFAGGRKVNKNDLQPGDLVFFNYPGERSPGHVGIYVGGGMMVHDHGASRGVQYQAVDWSAYVGARCYIGAHNHTGAAAGTFTPHDPNALKPPVAAGPKGATQATIIGVRASIDTQIRTFRNLAPDVRKYLSDAGVAAEKHLEQLRAHLRKGMSSTDLAQTRAGIQRWGKVLRDEIAKATKAASDAAAEHQRLLERAVNKAIQARFRDFDKETQEHNQQFEKDTAAHIASMRKAFDAQIKEFDRQTEAGLRGLASPTETPEEAALRQFQAARQAEADAKAMAAAQASGDPEQVRQLQLDLQERALEESAKQSRDAADKQAQAAQDAYRDQRQTQRDALDQQESDLEQAYQDQRALQAAAYNERRADQLQAMQDDLDDWNAWIDAKRKTWQQFLHWLKDHGFAVPDSWLVDTTGEKLDAAFGERVRELMIRLRSTPVPMQHGGTIRAPWAFNRDAVPLLAQHGETVLTRDLTDALERALAGGGVGGMTLNVNLNGPVYGGDRRKIAYELARPIADEINRLVG